MSDGDSGAGGRAAPSVLASLRSLGASAVGIARTRLQLLANELEEQRARTLQMVVWGAIALFCAAVGILLLSAWIVVALWDQYRLATIAVLALIYFAGCVAALKRLKTKAAERPKLFASSLAELRRDQDLLRS
ncbi:MAG: phage holin family protein [Burkholderiales bacterium]|nr:phage holin family protein [Burkholderiales bacterium]